MYNTKRIFSILVILLFLKAQVYCQVHYVNQTANTGANNGINWQNAFTDLYSALNTAQFGDTIWVAKGMYKPSSAGNRNAYFELRDGVRMFGGFIGNENSFGQRDWANNQTILSGDIGLQGDSTDNSHTILYIGLSDSTTILDGFILRDGNSNGPDDTGLGDIKHSGGALNIEAKDGYAYPKIRNCRFENNYAAAFGGGVYIEGKPSGSVAPQFIDCSFIRNKSGIDGGGAYRNGGSWAEVKGDFTNCMFEENTTNRFGGGLFFSDAEGIDTFEILNSHFKANMAGSSKGGGSAIIGGRNASGSNLVIDGCLFDQNTGSTTTDLYIQPFFFSFCTYFSLRNSQFNSTSFEATFFAFNEESAYMIVKDCKFNKSSFNIDGCMDRFYLQNNSINGGRGTVSIIKKIYIDGCNFQNSFDPLYVNGRDSCFLTNCIFSDNWGSIRGNNNSTSPTTIIIENSTFYKNILQTDLSPFEDYDTPYLINNSIFKENTTFLPLSAPFDTLFFEKQVPFLSNNVSISNSLLDAENCDTASLLNISCSPGMLYNTDPLFLDTAAGDYRLHPCSPARNAGSNAAAQAAGLLTDIAGLPRIQEGTVDMGAHETPAFAVGSATVTAPPCTVGALAIVELALDWGCPPFFLSWAEAAGGGGTGFSDTSLALLQLPAGSYTVTVTDGRTQATTTSFTIAPPTPLTATLDATAVQCATGTGPSTGGIATATPLGGTGPFTYSWNGGQTTTTATDLPPGQATVTITDANGCTATSSVQIGLVGDLQVGVNIIEPFFCQGEQDGVVQAVPFGGTPPFAYQWEGLPWEQSPTLDSVGPGSYSATVTDALGCTGDVQFNFGDPTAISVSVEVEQPACHGEMGTATANASGGTPGFTFLWDTGTGTETAMLPPGIHSVTAMDANGCTGTAQMLVTEPPLPTAFVAAQPQTLCFEANNGQLAALPQGGTPPYTYDWGDSLPPDSLLTGIGPGNYTLTLTDANGCSATASANVAEHTEIIALLDSTANASGPGIADGGVAIASVSGGTGSGYAYSWSNGSNSQDLVGVVSGDYSLTVTDAQGCTASFSFFVDLSLSANSAQPNPFGAAIVPNPSGRGTRARVQLSKAEDGLVCRVFDEAGRLVATGTIEGMAFVLPAGLAAGSYRVVLQDGERRAVLNWVVE